MESQCFYISATILCVIASLFMLISLFADDSSSPICSKYDNEKQLLERVIRNEVTLEDTLDKIWETHAKVAETLKQIEKQNAKLNKAIRDLEEKEKAVCDKVDAFIATGSQKVSETVAGMSFDVPSLIVQTAKELDVIKEKYSVPQVMFHARQSSIRRSYTTSQGVLFMTVLINDGGGYDATSGHFTAPVAGVYMFAVNNCPCFGKNAFLEIVHAGRPLQRSSHTSYENGDLGTLIEKLISKGHKYIDYGVCVSMQAFAKVAKGDKVWVRATNPSEIWHDEYYRSTSFAGLLIRL